MTVALLKVMTHVSDREIQRYDDINTTVGFFVLKFLRLSV